MVDREIIKKLLNDIMNNEVIPARKYIQKGRMDLLLFWYSWSFLYIKNLSDDLPEWTIDSLLKDINDATGTQFKNHLKVAKDTKLYYLSFKGSAELQAALCIYFDYNNPRRIGEYMNKALRTNRIVLYKTENDAINNKSGSFTQVESDTADMLTAECSLVKLWDGSYISTACTEFDKLSDSEWVSLLEQNL